MNTKTETLTKAQTAMLRMLAASTGNLTADVLLPHLYEHHKTTRGVHQTAASLVRRGLLRKHKTRPVSYSITPNGEALLAESAKMWVVRCQDYSTKHPMTKTAAQELADKLNGPGSDCCYVHEIVRTGA